MGDYRFPDPVRESGFRRCVQPDGRWWTRLEEVSRRPPGGQKAHEGGGPTNHKREAEGGKTELMHEPAWLLRVQLTGTALLGFQGGFSKPYAPRASLLEYVQNEPGSGAYSR